MSATAWPCQTPARTAALGQLLEQYGADELEAAIKETLKGEVFHHHAVRLALDRRREQRQQPPPVALILPEHVRARDAVVRTHNLDTYDRLTEMTREQD